MARPPDLAYVAQTFGSAFRAQPTLAGKLATAEMPFPRAMRRWREGEMMQHNHSPKEERRIRDGALDETIAESFPASDPPSTLPNPDNDETPEDTNENGRADRDKPGRST
jgi:hypothetical protein